jgi:hypothetical protein
MPEPQPFKQQHGQERWIDLKDETAAIEFVGTTMHPL